MTRAHVGATKVSRSLLDEDESSVTFDLHGAAVPVAVHDVYPLDGVSLEKGEQRIPREGRAVGEAQMHRRIVGRCTTSASAAPRSTQCTRRHAVLRTKGGVESAKALESARIGDARYRQSCIGEKPLREEKAMRLGELERRRTDLALERATKVALADAEILGELPD
jgi:hypothetical protein